VAVVRQRAPFQIIVTGTSPRAGWALSYWEPAAAQNFVDTHETPPSPSSSVLALAGAPVLLAGALVLKVAVACTGLAGEPSTTPSVVNIASPAMMIFRIGWSPAVVIVINCAAARLATG